MKALFRLGSQTIDLDVSQEETVSNVKVRLSKILYANPNDIELFTNSIRLSDNLFFNEVSGGEPYVTICLNEDAEDVEEEDFDLEYSNQVETPNFTPAGLEEQISNLMSLGPYSHSLCEQALRMSYFNIDKAAEFLISGSVPDSPPIDLYHEDENDPFSKLSNEDKEFIRDLIFNYNYDFSSVMQCFDACEKSHEGTLQLLQSI